MEEKTSTEELKKTLDKNILGFWIYLMTDLIMFGVLFACYIILRHNTFGGPGERALFSLPIAFTETLILLTSSFTCGLGVIFAREQKRLHSLISFGITFCLGLSFLTMELTEFTHLITDGNSPQRSAFLSSFFTLVGTHGLHIASGLLWLFILFIFILKKGFTPSVVRKLTLFSIFWHFLDVVWIFIFTVVYLMGVSY